MFRKSRLKKQTCDVQTKNKLSTSNKIILPDNGDDDDDNDDDFKNNKKGKKVKFSANLDAVRSNKAIEIV